jgi:hypothetical protein
LRRYLGKVRRNEQDQALTVKKEGCKERVKAYFRVIFGQGKKEVGGGKGDTAGTQLFFMDSH